MAAFVLLTVDLYRCAYRYVNDVIILCYPLHRCYSKYQVRVMGSVP
jgi:hypothetical protein